MILKAQELSTIFNDKPSWAVLCFKGKSYSLLFFPQLIDCWRRGGKSITSLNLENLDIAALSAELSISFLGSTTIYWCQNISSLDINKRKKFLALAQNYSGPHQLIFFTTDSCNLSDNSFAQSIDVDEMIDRQKYQELYNFFYGSNITAANNPESNVFARTLFAKHKTLPLDRACLLMRYNTIVGERDRDLCSLWVDKLIVPDKSLFTLAQYLYARDYKQFMQLWSQLEEDYPPEFWIAFFSEQLWQGILFIDGARDHGPVAARKRVNRLPFSFMQRDYKRYKERELTVAYNFLYSVDRGLKNGRATFGLELFFMHFLQGNFATK